MDAASACCYRFARAECKTRVSFISTPDRSGEEHRERERKGGGTDGGTMYNGRKKYIRRLGKIVALCVRSLRLAVRTKDVCATPPACAGEFICVIKEKESGPSKGEPIGVAVASAIRKRASAPRAGERRAIPSRDGG